MTSGVRSHLLAKLHLCEKSLQADNLILWLFDEENNALVATLSTSLPLEADFLQPISKGLTSQCFLTGLPLLENNLPANQEHDPTFDSISGKKVKSLMAAPIFKDDELEGVLTAACFEESSQALEFDSSSLAELQSAARKLQID
ncbi:MAG: GAF domain-containing protein [Roseibacillus sp.]